MTHKVALVTGASSGIGYQIALAWGHTMGPDGHLILIGRNEGRLDELAHQLHQYGASTTILMGDLADFSFIDDIMAYVDLYVKRIDAVFACAGYGDFSPTLTYTAEAISHLIQVNLTSTIYLTQQAGQRMVKQSFGHISMIASMAGKIPTTHSAIYSASKAGLIAYADGLRLDLAKDNIDVVTINPGPVETPFFNTSEANRAYFNRIAPLALQPDRLAEDIVANSLKTSGVYREINQPRIMSVAHIIYTLLPDLADWVNRHGFNLKGD